jgi:hypothetical protein
MFSQHHDYLIYTLLLCFFIGSFIAFLMLASSPAETPIHNPDFLNARKFIVTSPDREALYAALDNAGALFREGKINTKELAECQRAAAHRLNTIMFRIRTEDGPAVETSLAPRN